MTAPPGECNTNSGLGLLPLKHEKCREIRREFNLTAVQSHKVIDLGVNRKPMYDFLLVTNCNFGRICYRFPDIDA